MGQNAGRGNNSFFRVGDGRHQGCAPSLNGRSAQRTSPLVTEALDKLHDSGVRLAMDDFGTGHSSLCQLAKLPFYTIKIDQSLIGESEKQKAIVRSIVALGTGIGMSVLAEGIETVQKLEDIRFAGCHLAQGYLFGKAVPADETVAQAVRLLRT